MMMKILATAVIAACSTLANAQTVYYLRAASSGIQNNSNEPAPGANYNLTLQIVTSIPVGAKVLSFRETTIVNASGLSSSYLESGLQAIYVMGVPPTMKVIEAATGAVVGTVNATAPYTLAATGNGVGFKLADGTVIASGPHLSTSYGFRINVGWAGGGSAMTIIGPNACGSSYGNVQKGYGNGVIYNPTSGGCGYPQQAQAGVNVSYMLGY